MTGYQHTTMTQAEDSVLLRLSDSAAVRFLRDEANLCVQEAIRTFACLTGLWQRAVSATIPAGTTLFDIPTYFPSLRGYTLQDRDLVGIIQYHFWEPKNVSGWSGTDMFTLAMVTEAIQRRRDQFLLETACRLTRHAPIPATPPIIAAGASSIELDGSIMAVRRVAWIDAPCGRVTSMWPSSFASASGANPLWNVDRGTPRTYLFAERTPHLLEFIPEPANDGTLDLLSVDTGAVLNPTAGVLLGVPDDMAWVIKWGAMADLLSNDGSARDYARSLFCQRRWMMGIAAAQLAQTVLYAEINGRPAQFSSLQGLDQSRPSWQNESAAVPRLVPLAGMNIAGIYPPPTRDTAVSLTLVRNAPIVDANNYLQIGKELLDVVLGYAVHLAMFKVSGQEFAATTHLADAFFGLAVDHNERLREHAAFEKDQPADQAEVDKREQKRGVRRVTGATVQ